MSSDFDLTIITPTIPEREGLYAELCACIAAQTVAPKHLTKLDVEHQGVIPTVNELADEVDTEWLFPLADDDLLDADHCEVLSHWLSREADVFYTWCRIEGGGEEHPENQFQVNLQEAYGWDYLRTANWIPASAAIRTDLWCSLGGYQQSEWTDHEDWDFWVRALDAGATFACIPAVTWTYRMNAEWDHLSTARNERAA